MYLYLLLPGILINHSLPVLTFIHPYFDLTIPSPTHRAIPSICTFRLSLHPPLPSTCSLLPLHTLPGSACALYPLSSLVPVMGGDTQARPLFLYLPSFGCRCLAGVHGREDRGREFVPSPRRRHAIQALRRTPLTLRPPLVCLALSVPCK